MTYSFDIKPHRPMTEKEVKAYQQYMLEAEKKQRLAIDDCLGQQWNKAGFF